MSFIFRIVGIRARFVFISLFALGVGVFCSTRYVPTEYLYDIYPLLAVAAVFFFLLALLMASSVITPVNALISQLKSRADGESFEVVRPGGYDVVSQMARELNEYFVKVDDSHLSRDTEQAKILEEAKQLKEVVEDTGSDIELLLSVAGIVNGTGDLPAIASSVLKGMNTHIKAGWSSLFFLDEDEKLKMVASEGLDCDLSTLLLLEGSRDVQYRKGEGLSGEALATLTTQVANEGYKDKRFKLFSGSDNHYRNIHNLCIVPLVDNEKGIGLLMVFNMPASKGFSEDNVRFIERVGRLMSLAVSANQRPVEGLLVKHVEKLTGLLTPEWWRVLADTEIERASRSTTSAGFLLLELVFKARSLSPAEKSRIVSLVGGTVRRNLRGVDIACRDGYLFKVLLPQTNSLGTMYLAGRIKDACDALACDTQSGDPLFSTIAGAASFPEDVENVQELEDSVAQVLETARKSGDGRLVCVEKGN